MKKVRFNLILTTVILVFFQISPIVLNGGLYASVKYIITFLVMISFLFSLKKFSYVFFTSDIIRKYIIVYFIFLVACFVLYAFGLNVAFEPLIDLTYPLLFMMISYSMLLSTQQFRLLLKLVAYLSVLVSLSLVLFYAKGFVIYDVYLPVPKNQIGLLIATSVVITFFLANLSSSSMEKVLFLSLSFLTFSCLLVLRARASLLSVIISLLVYYLFYKRNIRLIFGVSSFFLLVIWLTPFGEMLYNAFFLNYDITDINSVSANRTDDYILGVSFLEENLLSGQLLGNLFQGGRIHNYVLDKLVLYGLVLSSGFLFVYLLLAVNVFKYNIFRSKVELYHVGPFVLIVPFVISLFEPTFPFAPGSAVFIAYFCFAQFLRNKRTSCIESCK